ncbi:MAG: hypothetical protein JSV86_14165 [Gemmatimonadota bacterium]|nr:MAG: hypothetical protein JSV86_14165 [Gemmatimonadota bacterium]
MTHAPYSLALALALAINGAALAQETSLDSLRDTHTLAAQRVAELAAARDSAEAWAEELFRLIPEARERDTGTLRQTLAVAQFAADSLDSLDASLARALAAEREARGALIRALESELERTLSAAEVAPPGEKVLLTERAQQLANELAGIQEPLELPATELPAIAVGPGDGPEEIALKADFLSDRAGQLRNAADVVAGEMSRMQRRDRLHEEMRRLVAEVRLFDEAGLPPVAAEGEEGTSEQSTFDNLDGRTEPGDVPVALAGERALDLPIPSVEGQVQEPVDEETLREQLERLRADLLRRAEALERQAAEFRRLLRGPP